MSLRFKANAKADKGELWLYGDVGDGWGDCFTAKDVADALKNIGSVNDLDVHLFSHGGSVFDGIAIHNMLKNSKANVTVYIEGAAISIASVIALSGSKTYMADNALYMIHKPWTYGSGNSDDLRKTAETLDTIEDSIIGTYMGKVGDKATREQVVDWIRSETWFHASEAKEYGFIDEVTEAMNIAAKFDPNRFKYKNTPQELFASQKQRMDELRAQAAAMRIQILKNRLQAKPIQAKEGVSK